MDLSSKLKSYEGKMLMSILLGLGLATLFRHVCKGKNCLIFHAPKFSKIKGKTYKYDGKCFKYSLEETKCNNNNKIIKFA